MLKTAIPKFAATDIEKAINFYEQQLGFTTLFNYGDYAGLKRDAVEIHLWQCKDKYIAENTACRINVEGIETLYEEYKFAEIIHPHGTLATQSWGLKEFTILDLDGNAITFSEPVS
ncbi:VOC family protein [Cyanobacteria bacterium FACHB-472]|nr:VOC family protein [Cyanobacteria bacterium FACHB-472]